MDILKKISCKKKSIYYINKYMKLFERFHSIYLFGSTLNDNEIPNDIDILLIYSKYSKNLIIITNVIACILESQIGVQIDLTVLSTKEEKEAKFLSKLKENYLKLK